MTKVEDLIGQLLLRHNCVIIPSFGGFVAKPISARVDFKSGTIYPPSKSLLFNRQLINNDGLLVNELAMTNSIGFDEALNEVSNLVQNWKQALSVGLRIEIDKVGIIFQDEEKNLCFEQDRFVNLLLSSYGLEKVRFVSEEDVTIHDSKVELEISKEIIKEESKVDTPIISIATQKEEKTTVVSEEQATETKIVELPASAPKRSKAWKYIAAACLLPIAFYSIWIPMKTDVLESGVVSFKDFNPFYQTETGKYSKPQISEVNVAPEYKSVEDIIEELPENTETYSFKASPEKYVIVNLASTIQENTLTEETTNVSNNEVVSPNAMNYIVGCFGVKENADNLVADLKSKGLDARIFDFHNGLHRVSAGAALSSEALKEIKITADNLGFKGWILK